ncbi:MAG: hypothetical protein K2L87_04315 [Clostridiales bacterium]|nr:hypothetical protein [Clostridiales bacterium]
MIQRRNNPFETQTTPEAPVQQPAPVEQKEIQKRVNPLTLEERPVVVQQTPPPAPKIAPTTIVGKTKKKRAMAKVNKELLLSLIAKTGKKAGEMLDAAMLAYAFSAYPELFESFKKSLNAKGCELK